MKLKIALIILIVLLILAPIVFAIVNVSINLKGSESDVVSDDNKVENITETEGEMLWLNCQYGYCY